MPKRQSEPGMRDPTNKELHRPEGRDPYPEPRKGVRKAGSADDDLVDPGEVDPEAPHDRGVEEGGEYLSARDQMDRKIRKDKEAWREGRTQNVTARRK